MNENTLCNADDLIRAYVASYHELSTLKLIGELLDMLDFFGYAARRNGLWLETEEGLGYRFYRHHTDWEIRSRTI